MSKLGTLFRLSVISLILFLHLQFVKSSFVDSCLDRGGRFLSDKLMCEGETGFISFSLTPFFYFVSCVVFGILTLGVLKLIDRPTD